MERIRPGIELPLHEIADRPFDFAALFPGCDRVECEIGFCSALFLTEYANRNPRTGILGIEKKHAYFLRGLHNLERKLKQDNVKAVEFDARSVIEMLVPASSLDTLHVYFPDPWPKKRHHKRRLLQPAFVHALALRLAPGGYLHAATDWEDYAQEMLATFAGEPLLVNTVPGFAPRPPWRPQTKFETRGMRLGHGVFDLVFRRGV